MTLKDFIHAKNSDLGEAFSEIIFSICTSAIDLNSKLARSGLIKEQGSSGEKNVYGEDVQKLDTYANTLITDKLLTCKAVHAVGSEELAEPKFSGNAEGKYIITHDPMDGSSNLDVNVSVGTIFAIYPKYSSMLQKGEKIIASGYIMYGASLMLVFATKNGVNAFTYDYKQSEYVLSRENIAIPEKKIYSINEGNWKLFGEGDQTYLSSIKENGGYSLRYVGSMVADIHRTILKGGIFIYPADIKHPEGKLRLLYEVAPLSFLIKTAGGEATSRGIDPLSIEPTKHDQRVPVAMGSKGEVEKYLNFQSSIS